MVGGRFGPVAGDHPFVNGSKHWALAATAIDRQWAAAVKQAGLALRVHRIDRLADGCLGLAAPGSRGHERPGVGMSRFPQHPLDGTDFRHAAEIEDKDALAHQADDFEIMRNEKKRDPMRPAQPVDEL
jgi:hypothetical protein